jgi:hypothetical protein
VAALEERIKQAKDRLVQLDPKAAARASASQGAAGRQAVVASAGLPGIVIDDDEATLSGAWTLSTSVRPYVDGGYRHASADATATYTFDVPDARGDGKYELRLAFSPNPNRATHTPVTIEHAGGKAVVRINQRQRPNVDGVFHSLGVYVFSPDSPGRVTIGTDGAGGVVILDALQVVPAVDEAPADAALADADADDEDDANTAAQAKRDAQAAALSDRLKQLESDLAALKKNAPPSPPRVMAVREMPDPGDWHVHVRGGIRNLGPKVERGFLSVAWREPSPPAIPDDASGRLELAEWIANADNPLTARVMVNRIWHHLFGEGIVRTPDNFGATGQRPTHPRLLDWLAVRFVEEGWSVKRMIRLIVASRAYQMDSVAAGAVGPGAAGDPENRMLSHQNRKRLDAEAIYDAMLSISGELDLTAGGLTMRPGTRASYGYDFQPGRRGVYLPVFRNAILDLFEVFDFADPNLVIGDRPVSTLPTQALYLLNSPLVMRQAERAAKRLLADERFAELDAAGRVDFIYERTLGRPATAGERDLTLRHVASFGEGDAVKAWASVQHALFASLDFRYVD